VLLSGAEKNGIEPQRLIRLMDLYSRAFPDYSLLWITCSD
jgi:hypothetical protein